MLGVPSVEELRQRRLELGLTQKQLAEMAGISQPLVARIERGTVDPRTSTLRRIVAALNRVEGAKAPTAREFMAGKVVAASPGDPIRRAIKTMTTNGYSQLPVLERGRNVGVLSERRILEEIERAEDPRELAGKKVAQLMGPPLPTVEPEAPLASVERLLEDYPAVLIVERGEVAGMITKADLLRLIP